jgi:hypothetical protein
MPMTTLRIHHGVPSFEAWQRAFESDPVGRKAGGVRAYSVRRAVQDPNLVMIDLEFVNRPDAEAFLEKLRKLWDGPAKSITVNPEAWVVETVVTQQL